MELNPEDIELINYFAYLPDETIFDIALNLSPNNIANLCRTDTRFNAIVCNDNYFWENKFKRTFGDVNFHVDDWKSLYMNAGNVTKFLGVSELTTLRNIHAIDIAFNGPNGYSVIIDFNNDVWVWVKADDPYKINIKAKKISCSHHGTMLIDINDNVWITLRWDGYTEKFEPLNQIQNIKAKEISLGNGHLGIIDLNNNVWMLGNNEYGQLGLGYTGHSNYNDIIMIPGFKAKKITCSNNVIYSSTAFIDMNDDIWTFGSNGFGQLGLGNDSFMEDMDRYISVPTKIPGLKGKEIAMSEHTMVIDLEGKLWGFGSYKDGKLGLGWIFPLDNPLDNVDTPTQIMSGDKLWNRVVVTPYNTVALDDKNNISISGTIYNQHSKNEHGRWIQHDTFHKIEGYKALNISAVGTSFITMDI